MDSLIVPETVSPNQGDLEAKLEEIRKEQERLTRRSRDLKKQISQQRELFKSESKRRLARDGSFRRMSAY
jgi:predicted  nucleic acid-binding Zn-ribbon protein